MREPVQLTSRDSRDASLAFPKLVDRGFLVSSGQEREKSCCLPGSARGLR
jgi:ATP-dependent DNA helicase RecG